MGKLRICRHCERLWLECFDTREHYTWYRDLGHGTVDVLTAGTSPLDVVDWAARELPESAVFWCQLLLAAWLRKRPDTGQATLDRVVEILAGRVREPGELAALRRLAVLQFALAAVKQRSRAQGRSADGGVKPDPKEIRRVCAAHQPNPGRAVAYLGKSATVVRRIARTVALRAPPRHSDGALELEDPTPLVAAALANPMPGEKRGYPRGQRLRRGLECLLALRRIGGRWSATAPTLSMPPEGWRTLDAAMDPVSLLATAVSSLLDLRGGPAERRRDQILECAEYLPLAGDLGGRIGPHALAALDALAKQMEESSAHPDRAAHPSLVRLVARFRRLAASDCTAVDGACAS
ncbi:MAG: hypothetical protein R3200_15575 [Xanthomonadales bacterium]|nr:hypothetical protein [Xanthomonadales bacterium]